MKLRPAAATTPDWAPDRALPCTTGFARRLSGLPRVLCGGPGNGVNGFGMELTGQARISPACVGVHAVVVSTRYLAGGNIELHNANPSSTWPSLTDDQSIAPAEG